MEGRWGGGGEYSALNYGNLNVSQDSSLNSLLYAVSSSFTFPS